MLKPTLPNVLGDTPEAAEGFVSLLPVPQSGLPLSPVTLDLAAVRWVRPYGAVLLLEACRHLARCTGGPVCLVNMQTSVHAYLRRIDFFERAAASACTTVPFDPMDDLSRSLASCNVLELFPIASLGDVYAAVARARQILAYWLGDASYNIAQIVSLLSEACGNAAEHSRDVGMLTIQKYEWADHTGVLLAISDSGQGIRRSLVAAHGQIAGTDASYILKALEGLSSRQGGRGGLGLGAMKRIATTSGGSLHIRSGAGRIAARGSGLGMRDGLAFLPGTQIAVTFRSRLGPTIDLATSTREW